MKLKTGLIILVLVLLIGGGAGGWYWIHSSGTGPALRTAPVKRGDLHATITANGTIEPEEVVDVGAQVAGLIEYFGKDPSNPGKTIDYGSQVEVGTILAHIDDTLYAADVLSAQAGLDQAKVAVQHGQADLQQYQAKLYEAQRDWDRAQKIAKSDALSETTYDQYQSTYEQGKANVALGQAEIAAAEAGVKLAEAALEKAKRNVSYCTITSPVKGVIIDRRVNIGQTVVSSLSAPSLFLIAKDLKKMQIWTSVNEADIGSIYPGQPANFTVDAFPGQIFKGQVNKVRLNATMTQNVVTYTVEINTENSSAKLLPYLTANVEFEVSHRDNVLLVPNAALRWYPQLEQVAPDARDAVAGTMEKHAALAAAAQGGAMPDGTPSAAAPHSTHRATSHEQALVWTADGAYVRPLKVNVGLTDGTNTEVAGDDVKERIEVVTGEQQPQTSESSTNPFTPQFGKHR